jgi:hypothetical protein
MTSISCEVETNSGFGSVFASASSVAIDVQRIAGTKSHETRQGRREGREEGRIFELSAGNSVGFVGTISYN